MATDQESVESSETTTASGKGKKLLERAWDALWGAGFEDATARQYVSWMLDYVLFHGKRHPQEMGVPEVRAFLADGRFSGPRRHNAWKRRRPSGFCTRWFWNGTGRGRAGRNWRR